MRNKILGDESHPKKSSQNRNGGKHEKSIRIVCNA